MCKKNSIFMTSLFVFLFLTCCCAFAEETIKNDNAPFGNVGLISRELPLSSNKESGLKSASQFESSMSIQYTLEVVDTVSHVVKIIAFFQNVTGQKTNLTLPTQSSPTYDVGSSIYLSNVSAYSENGVALKITRQGATYTVTNNTETNFFVTYLLVMNQRWENGGPLGYLGETYLLSQGDWTFLAPTDGAVSSIRVNFSVPSGWGLVTPWTEDGNGYVETDVNRFYNATFAAGHFEKRTENINGTLVTVAVDKGFDAKILERILEGNLAIYPITQSYFQAAKTPDKHLSIFAKAASYDEWQYINEAGTSHGEAILTLNDSAYDMAHRVFHTYNLFWPAGMNLQPTWFIEGPNEYFAGVTHFEARVGYPFNSLKYKYNQYLKERSTYDVAIAGATRTDDTERDDFVFYTKGALVSYLLDQTIKDATPGSDRKGFADVHSQLYSQYGNLKGGTVTETVIRDVINAVAGVDLSVFFGKYLDGTEVINLDDVLADADEDGLYRVAENLLGTSDNDFDTDKDGASDFAEYRDGSDPLLKSSRPERPVFVDGNLEEWNGLPHLIFQDDTGQSACSTDIKSIRSYCHDNVLYVAIEGACAFSHLDTLRYYINVDTDKDGVGNLQFAATYQTLGDTSKFYTDWTNYDFHSMDEFEGTLSFLGDAVEMAIPLYFFTDTSVDISAGIWNSATGEYKDWMQWFSVELSYADTGCEGRYDPVTGKISLPCVVVNDSSEEYEIILKPPYHVKSVIPQSDPLCSAATYITSSDILQIPCLSGDSLQRYEVDLGAPFFIESVTPKF